MLFITNRTIIDYDKQFIDRPFNNTEPFSFYLEDNTPNPFIHFCELWNDQFFVMSNEMWFEKIKDKNYKNILFFIHGYNTLPHNAFTQSIQLQELCEEHSVMIVPVIWPCTGQFGYLRNYFDDRIIADKSDIAFARMLKKFEIYQKNNSNCSKRMFILAHSMGNRVLRESINSYHRYFNGSKLIPHLFRKTFMSAADLKNTSLNKGTHGELICQISKHVIVYFADDDWALRGSKVLNGLVSKRLGHLGVENFEHVPKNVFQFNCSEFNNNLYDDILGHTYIFNDNVFNHIIENIKYSGVKKYLMNWNGNY